MKETALLVQGLHPDDDQDCSINQLMQAPPPRQVTKQLPSDHVDHFMDSSERDYDVQKWQDVSSEDSEEDIDDYIEDRNTP